MRGSLWARKSICRFVVRYTKAIADRDGQLEPRVSALESRVKKLEPSVILPCS